MWFGRRKFGGKAELMVAHLLMASYVKVPISHETQEGGADMEKLLAALKSQHPDAEVVDVRFLALREPVGHSIEEIDEMLAEVVNSTTEVNARSKSS